MEYLDAVGIDVSGQRFDPDPSTVTTHLSTLVFLGEYVFKFRKHVQFEFLDLSSVESRRIDCEREVQLNQRLAPDVYLGVGELILADQLIEPVVIMRRLPQDRSLAMLLREGTKPFEELRSIARTLVEFHSFAIRSSRVDADATSRSILRRWTDNFSQTSALAEAILDQGVEMKIQQLARQYLAGREMLFDQRISAGAICDGHGDLQASDIFLLPDGPRILDCLEFDDHLRHLDVVDDLSFLLMDIERLATPELARYLRDFYEELSDTHAPGTLFDHYAAYHAYVRAKVACLRADQDKNAKTEARRLQLIAIKYLERSRIQLIIVGGLPGTGKSTISRMIGEQIDAVVLRSDELRHEVVVQSNSASDASAYRQGHYSPETTSETYRTMLDRAEVMLRNGTSVILDASWISGEHRSLAFDLSEATASEFVELCCVLDETTAARRINARRRRGDDVSDATTEIARLMAMDADPWPTASVIDTSLTKRRCLRMALAAVGKEPGAGAPKVSRTSFNS